MNLRCFRRSFLPLLFLAARIGCLNGHAQGMAASEMEVANLREDVRMLTQKVGELSLNLEQLQRENNDLKSRSGQGGAYATLAQLNQAIADLNRSVQAAQSEQKREIIEQVGVQMEKLAKQTQAAIDALTKGGSPAPSKPTSTAGPTIFTNDYPQEGITYTVQKGDTLTLIAKKNNASLRDIKNANKISDETKILVGQTLFIPQKKN